MKKTIKIITITIVSCVSLFYIIKHYDIYIDGSHFFNYNGLLMTPTQLPDSIVSLYGDLNANIRFVSRGEHHMNTDMDFPRDFCSVRLWCVINISKNDFVEFKTFVDSVAIDKFNAADNNYGLLIDEAFHYYYTHLYKEKDLFNNMTKPYLIPMNIKEYQLGPIKVDTSTLCQFPADYNIYIMKYGDDNILGEKYGARRFQSKLDIPEEYRHGYISLVAFGESNKHVLFYACAW